MTKTELLLLLAKVGEDTVLGQYDPMKDCIRPLNLHLLTHKGKDYLMAVPVRDVEIR